MRTVNPNELRETMKVYQIGQGGYDENGFPVSGVEVLHELRCKRKTMNTREYVAAGREWSDETYKFICYNRGFDAKAMFIEYNGKHYDIGHINEFADRQFCEITATETLPPSA